jgi:hypothetical protein
MTEVYLTIQILHITVYVVYLTFNLHPKWESTDLIKPVNFEPIMHDYWTNIKPMEKWLDTGENQLSIGVTPGTSSRAEAHPGLIAGIILQGKELIEKSV